MGNLGAIYLETGDSTDRPSVKFLASPLQRSRRADENDKDR